MKTILFLLLTFLSFNCTAQIKGTYQIELTSTASALDSEFKIHLFKGSEKAKIVYFKRMQQVVKLTRQDSLEAEVLFNSFRNDLVAKKRLIDILDKYKVYEEDSLTISLNHPLLRLGEALSNEKNLNAIEGARNMIVLDGTSVMVKVRYEDEPEYELYARSPRKDTHPLIYQFIQDALELYRTATDNPILQKEDTHGY